jgi:hypothetical protein
MEHSSHGCSERVVVRVERCRIVGAAPWSEFLGGVREIRTLRSTWRGLETWHGRDGVTLANERARQARQSSTLPCRSRSRSMASLWPQAIAETRAITISNTSCRMRLASRSSGIASASRPHTPSPRSACRSSNRPPSEDWLPPSKSTVSFLHRTDGRSKGTGVSSVMAAVAVG